MNFSPVSNRVVRGWMLSVAATGLLSACSQPAPDMQSQPTEESSVTSTIQTGVDYHSYANPSEIAVKHIDLDLTANFDKRILEGSATLTVERMAPEASTLMLDTRDLSIESVTFNGEPVDFSLAKADPNLGSALSISLPASANKVTVNYHTSPDASGVQWLTPAQTAGKQHPFLFTQAQALHARSFIPLQDSPKVRVTYNARIQTPEALLAVMSASNDPDTARDGDYHFTMPQPIPSYLIALAIGDLAFKPMGERTGVYAEPALLDAAAKEFEDTEEMLEVTEASFGEYQWDRYDLLILPPSFPFGGMENPRLSFITPTVIAGDKSLVALIAHELAHSWSGNTVTNATWRDLWLNEGFTTYLTYRIMEMIYGTDRYNMEAVLGYQDLQADISSLDKNDQILAIDLRGRDADDVFSNIPYEKGALFLREIEHKIGRDNFDAFLLQYFQDFAFKSITTDEFITYLDKTLLAQYPDKLSKDRIHTWIFEPGIPENTTVPSSDAFSKIDTIRSQWLAGEVAANDINTAEWTVHEWLYFLNNLPEKLSNTQLSELDNAFQLTQSRNNEIAHSWLMVSVKNTYEPAYARLHDYLVSIGRNKLVKPLYRALSKTPEGKTMAQKAFAEAKAGYHPLTVKANEGFVK
ncbi:M1 family metallopeptidase [Aestuariibacter sp. AA17]|uniref:Aminopeptidase N n=1 Tax=Fluctibacter corallii TaxID=2984329 RepID=A0ABT3AB51_9ALTE|nr:M1 family metallopeptidase [Aestuariibacter sp. AA17]MCV2885526.1 M1 family metallopeptidase [Aestuariibacter sp. AA17]